ncbi:Hypothetical predicted protein [Marmota monax]|uniref:Uncharacterized protein n=1 Tax=Marmota monax TaxID=9995 RepID=A0A5E4CKR3_MARMO|nr:hypothetical protein GHT09_020243 [Marmota monax]VTJ82443.1 Hypothetical predicted protein [Marmota monax]
MVSLRGASIERQEHTTRTVESQPLHARGPGRVSTPSPLLRVPAARRGAGGQHRLSPPVPRIRAAPDRARPKDLTFRRTLLDGVYSSRDGGSSRGGKQPARPGRRGLPLAERRSSPAAALAASARGPRHKASPSRPARPPTRTGTCAADRKVPL